MSLHTNFCFDQGPDVKIKVNKTVPTVVYQAKLVRKNYFKYMAWYE